MIMVFRLALIRIILNLDLSRYSRIRLSTKVSGSQVLLLGQEKENRHGLMDLCMKVGGKKTRQMERDVLYTQMVMYMMVCGSMTRLMDTEYTAI